MSVIVARALPDVRDGLKPVHRRILFAMKELGLTKSSQHKKSARIVGEVLGKYHPHGDMAVYDAMVRLAQDFSMRYPLIDGQGNFGSVDGDSPAAMRYTEARMERITQELLWDIDKETVPFTDNFDGSQQEPTVLPAKLPNLLLMGSEGIAVGMATKIPPHNLVEVCNAIKVLIDKGKSETQKVLSSEHSENSDSQSIRLSDNQTIRYSGTPSVPEVSQLETMDSTLLVGEFSSDAGLEDLLQFVKGPDFPTGGVIYDAAEVAQVYLTGRGRIVTRGVAGIQEGKAGRAQIIISQLPYQVNKARLVAKIADLVKEKKISGVSDLRDESDRDGLRVAVDLKKDAIPKSVLNQIYKHTELQTVFSANMVALNSHGVPQVMNLKTILTEFVRHRQLVVARRSQFELKQAKARSHILEGLLKAIDILDEVIATIKKSKDADEAKTNLVAKFGFSEIQATAILDMQLRKLAALERQKLLDEYEVLKETISYLISLLTHPEKILTVISDELKYLRETYGDVRKTKVVKGKIGEFSELDLVPAETNIIVITESGYIKRMPLLSYRSQRRGGKGVKGMQTKEEDAIGSIFIANTHDDILFFTNKGKVYKLKVFELPEGQRQAKGQAIINLLSVEQEELVQSVLPVAGGDWRVAAGGKQSNTGGHELQATSYVLLATKRGLVKKTAVSEFANIKANGLIAIDLRFGDELVNAAFTSGPDHVLLVTKAGKSIRFAETDIRPTGRDTQGVKGLTMAKDDTLITMVTFPAAKPKIDDKRKKVFRELLVVTEKGLGKRTDFGEYPVQRRSGQGVKVAKLSVKTGKVAGAIMVTEMDEFAVITTTKAQVIKLPLKNIPSLGRSTQGVILLRMSSSSDSVAAVTTIKKEDN
jgi:DNA gyrase subunit A